MSMRWVWRGTGAVAVAGMIYLGPHVLSVYPNWSGAEWSDAAGCVAAALAAILSWILTRRKEESGSRMGWWQCIRVVIYGLTISIILTCAVEPEHPRNFFRAFLFISLAFILAIQIPAQMLDLSARRWIRRFDLVLFNLLLLAVLLEGGLRLAAGIRPSPLLSAPNVKTAKRIADYKLRPGEEHNGFRANSLGFYDREFKKEKPAGTVRILGLADSFGVETVAYADNFLTRAEEELNQGHKEGRRYEVLNLSVDAISPAGYLHLLEQFYQPYAAEGAVVCLFAGNDVTGLPRKPPPLCFLYRDFWYLDFVPRRIWRAAAATEGQGAISPNANMNPDVDAPPAQREGAIATQTARFTREAFLSVERERMRVCLPKGTDTVLDSQYRDLEAILRRMREHTKGHCLLLLIPDEFQVDDALWQECGGTAGGYERERPQTEFARMAVELGLPVLDLLPLLRNARQEGREVYRRNDTHWNERGHAAAAAALVAELKALLPVWTEERNGREYD